MNHYQIEVKITRSKYYLIDADNEEEALDSYREEGEQDESRGETHRSEFVAQVELPSTQ